jgi:GLPGLI family protein
MRKKLFFSLIALVSLFTWAGCGPAVDKGFISEGAISFNAEVMDTDNPMASYAPSKMVIKFKNNKSSLEMSAGMGALTTSFISNPETKTFIQLIKLLGTKYVVVQNEDEIKKENELFNIEVIPTKITKMIAGYKCKKATIHYKGGDPLDYDIYYTEGLNIKQPNFANPYFKIDGVLMEFQMKKFGLEMKFTATAVTKQEVDDATFELPTGCKKITPQEMTELFTDLM